ncbi:hypothetical protein M9458_008822, partial [Cirrhinus mrigala]
ACDLTMELNTAHTYLALSEKNKVVTYMRDEQPYPYHQERFDNHTQVLCRESLPGRCYWEAEWSGDADISVAYKGISRKGKSDDCVFGRNKNSWNLRVGVYVDVPAGTLSFYSVSDTRTLTPLHTFTTTFTKPLYAGFGLYFLTSVSLCQISVCDNIPMPD